MMIDLVKIVIFQFDMFEKPGGVTRCSLAPLSSSAPI